MTDTPAITVQDWAQTRAALQAARSQGRAVFLCSPQGASSWLGAGYWAALRAGVAAVIFRGEPRILAKLQDMAAQRGAELRAG